MALYRKVPQCRVCKADPSLGTRIDKMLLAGENRGIIVEMYSPQFPLHAPLTKEVLKSHWRHMKTAVEATAIARIQPPASTLNPANDPQDPARMQVFEAAVKKRVNELEAVTDIMDSSMADLDRLAYHPNETREDMLRRDRLRLNAATIVEKSAKIRVMQLEADEEKHRLEKSRVAFKLFTIMSRVMESIPEEFRAEVIHRLKEGVRQDQEINELLKAQSAAKPPTPEDDDVTDHADVEDSE